MPEMPAFLANFLEPRGPGSAWAAGLRAGQTVNVLGPGGGFRRAGASRQHVFLGDETCLGVFFAMARAAGNVTVTGAIEVEDGREDWPALAGLALAAVRRKGGDRGGALCRWVDQGPRPNEETTFYLAGHTGSIVRLRKKLFTPAGPSGRFSRSPIGLTGNRGCEKAAPA